jgi:hypothetical protein
LRFAPAIAGQQTTGAVIRFPVAGALGVRIADVWIQDAWSGISCEAPSAPNSSVNEIVINNVKMTGMFKCGIYAQHALNWMVSDTVIGMRILPGQSPAQAWPPGSSVYGVQLDTWTEGWIWRSVFVLGGEHCWRFNNEVSPTLPPPQEHRFIGCIGDNGSVSCFYATALRRCFFSGCWASAQTPGAVGFATDNLAVQELVWVDGEMVNIAGDCFKIISAMSFTIANSVFNEWGVGDHATDFAAIRIFPASIMSFVITGNKFSGHSEFSGGSRRGVIIDPGVYGKYVVTGNIGDSLAGTESHFTVWDSGNASHGKAVHSNV